MLHAPSAEEHVVLLDRRGSAAGNIPKAGVHSAGTPFHLAFSCHVVRRDGRVLLTRRALSKPTWPGIWTNACCGHPQPGEHLRHAVERRLNEELGLRPVAMAIAVPDFVYRASLDGVVEHELCPVLVALVDGEPVPSPSEVDDTAWVTWDDLNERATRSPASLSPWSVLQLGELRQRGWTPARVTELADRPADSALEWLASNDGGSAAFAAPAPDTLGRPAALVEPVLDEFVRERAAAMTALHPDMAGVVDEVTELVGAGGKRLRPAFVYWGQVATGSADASGAAHAAAAIELLHTFALLHDDVMDRSQQRRGRPSAHVALAERHRQRAFGGDAHWFGVSAAVLAGDVAFSWALDLFARAPVCAERRERASQLFTLLRHEVMAGQYLDLLHGTDPLATEQDAVHIALLKTARYSVTRPLQIGAALGGARDGDPLMRALQAYGDAVGVGFQLRDDVLGLFGDPAVTGKSNLDDVREGKRTLLMLRAVRLATPAQRKVLLLALGNPEIGHDDAQRVGDVVADTGALASIEARLRWELHTALGALVDVPDPARGALRELASCALARRS